MSTVAAAPAAAQAQAHPQLQAQPQAAVSALLARRVELQPQLRASPFGEPLVLSSKEGEDRLEGELHAEVAYPFQVVAAMFRSPDVVCEFLILHLNVHACQPSKLADGAALTLTIGPKRAQASAMMHAITYAMRTESAAGYLRMTLGAAKGPLSTHDYRIVFEAVPIEGGRTFVRLGYSYGFGTMARLAMQAYLATAGRSKIGFSVTGRGPDGRPQYVRGERGSLERNVMRYYLALLAHCSVNSGSPTERMEARMRAWFALTERYAAQLHELELDEYLTEKREDLKHFFAAGK